MDISSAKNFRKLKLSLKNSLKTNKPSVGNQLKRLPIGSLKSEADKCCSAEPPVSKSPVKPLSIVVNKFRFSPPTSTAVSEKSNNSQCNNDYYQSDCDSEDQNDEFKLPKKRIRRKTSRIE